MTMHISSMDLNLLRVFDALLEEKSVTRAGARLGLSQSAVSHALNRLRYALDDELFRRDSQGMTPTPRAMEIGPRLHAALASLQAAVTPADFDPGVSERRFAIAAGPYSCSVLVPPLVGRMAEVAPHTRLEISEITTDLVESLDAGQIDFVIAAFDDVPGRFGQEVLVREQLAWIVRAGHPLTQGEVNLERLVATPHVHVASRRATLGGGRRGLSMRSSYEDAGAFASELAMRGLSRDIGVTVPDTYAALAVVARSDMVSLIPRRLALISAQSGRLQLIDPPYASPTLEVNMLYRTDRLAEPSVAWMRQLLLDVCAEL